jgi:hypothetical protein
MIAKNAPLTPTDCLPMMVERIQLYRRISAMQQRSLTQHEKTLHYRAFLALDKSRMVSRERSPNEILSAVTNLLGGIEETALWWMLWLTTPIQLASSPLNLISAFLVYQQ